VLICVNQCLNIIRGNSWLKTIPFYAKQTQTFPFSAQKPRFSQKTNPKRTQTKPNCKIAKMSLCPLLTVYYEIFDNLGKMKTKPKQSQNKPNFYPPQADLKA
jgi:hypothetical protein